MRPSQLWQVPLLIFSVGLFAVAGYFFVHPYRAPTFEDKIAVARHYLEQERPDAALEQLNRMLQVETLSQAQEAIVHLVLAESLDADQRRLKLSIPENYRRIIWQTRIALAQGVKLDAPAERRLGDAYAALNDTEPAIDHYRNSLALDGQHAVSLRRKMIELLEEDQQPIPAEAAVDEYLKQTDLTAAERSWALGQKATLLIDNHRFAEARKMLTDAIKLSSDTVGQGELNYQLGYCAWKEGDAADAERYLRLARDQMKPTHPLDGDAAYVLGRIYQDRNDAKTANSLYEVTLISHPDSRDAQLALMGRGTCRIMLGETDAGLTDLHDLTAEISRRSAHSALRPQVVAGLRQAADLLTGQQNYQAALEVMAYEQQLQPDVPPNFFARLGEIYEKRAAQLQDAIVALPLADQNARAAEVRQTRSKAGDAYVANSRALTLVDDKGYGDALWHGIDLYDAAGDLPRVISALETFVNERPDDRLAPDALLRLGRAYQAAGFFDKAIKTFERNQFRYPNSLAASESAVPLAETFIASGSDNYPKAERVLLSVIEDNDIVDPSAEEFHQSLLALADLYYRTGRYELAIARLDETVQRYPTDQQLPRVTFLMADSYRKSAALLDNPQAPADGAAVAQEAAEVVGAKRDRLTKARELFDKVLTLYALTPPSADLDKLYQKLSTFYRADCMYDLGRFADAIKLYDQAAFRYQDDPAALSAYVQIVNSYCALGKLDDARTANERAKWILRRMPPEAFQEGDYAMPKKYWDDWLKWTSQARVF